MPNDAANQLRRLARDVEAAGLKVRREIVPRLRTAAVPMVDDIRGNADRLPAHGGFSRVIRESSITVRANTSARSAGVTIVGVRRKTGGMVDLRAVNAGKLRHPVFGNTDTWVNQNIPAGFWDRAIEKNRQRVYNAMTHLMDEIKRDIEK
jgi:hypothetical protein